ncbi:unnamed protein product [Symbiodinium sp. CCMP2592]|nr:unnamed protein product [Symbiodinium sp. CCMP2592]
MRTELKKDKYQRHIVEYWVDVKTSGSLSKTSREEFNQTVEIVDDNLQLPPPQLGNEALPCYDEEDDEDDDDDDEEEDGTEPRDKTSSVTPKLKRKRRGKTPSPKSKLAAKKKREKAEEVESALEDIDKIPDVLKEILKLRIKIDNTLDQLHKKNHGKDSGTTKTIGKLKEHLAQVEKLWTSRITMEEKKLKRTVLRSKPAVKSKAKGKRKATKAGGDSAEGSDEDEDEDDEKSATKHENASGRAFVKEGLSCPELRDLFYNGVTLKLNGGEDKTFFLVFTKSVKRVVSATCVVLGKKATIRTITVNVVPQSSAKEFMHKFDLFHTLHKGPGDIPVQLTAIYEMASEYCKSQNIPLHMDALTRNWFKGADTTAMCCFLENFWSNHISSLDAPDAYLSSMLDALRSANAFMRLLFRSGLWLSLDRCRAVAKAGLGFLKAYLEASHAAYTMRRTRFKVTPKFHAMIHIVDTLVCASNAKRQWTLSPLSESTQIDEDFVGRIASITTSVDSRVVHKQTLDRYKTNVWKHLTGRSEKE